MADFERRRVAVIATPAGNLAAQVAKAATTTIPIVFSVGEDPVKLGLVANLARPDGNATGSNFFASEVDAKRLGLLHELVPKAIRIAVLVNPTNVSAAGATLRDVPEAARALGLQIQVLNASTSREIETASLLCGTMPTPSLSAATRSSSAAASSLRPWRRATGFRQLMGVVSSSKSAG